MTELRQATLSLIAEAEARSGFPVEVVRDDASPRPASVRIARGDLAHHRVVFNPALTGEPDYAVAVQCGFILRHFAPPPEERVDLLPTEAGRTSVRDLVVSMIDRGRMVLPYDRVEGLVSTLIDGLGMQLRSVPVQLRIDAWLAADYPEFREAQVTAARRQLLDDEKALNSAGSLPAKIVRASLAMNAAVALYWAGELADDTIAVPYRRAGFVLDGRRLLRMWYSALDTSSSHETSDRSVSDDWARAVGIARWFEWQPYAAPTPAVVQPGGSA